MSCFGVLLVVFALLPLYEPPQLYWFFSLSIDLKVLKALPFYRVVKTNTTTPKYRNSFCLHAAQNQCWIWIVVAGQRIHTNPMLVSLLPQHNSSALETQIRIHTGPASRSQKLLIACRRTFLVSLDQIGCGTAMPACPLVLASCGLQTSDTSCTVHTTGNSPITA